MSASRTAHRAIVTVLAAGALVGAAALPAVADGHRAERSSIVVDDVQWDSRGHDNRALNGEWVELRNTSRHSVDLRGFTLTDQQGNRYRFTGLRLDGRSTVKVHTGHGRDTHHDVYQDRNRQIWDANDTATLRDNRGHVVDSDSWGHGHHHHG